MLHNETKLKSFDDFLNEEDSTNTDLSTEQTNQSKINDDITTANAKMAEIDKGSESDSEKMKQKATIKQQLSTLYQSLAQSVAKEGDLMKKASAEITNGNNANFGNTQTNQSH